MIAMLNIGMHQSKDAFCTSILWTLDSVEVTKYSGKWSEVDWSFDDMVLSLLC